MTGLTGLRGLRDVPTSISTHGRAVPGRRGSRYLDAYRLEMEKQRLETEAALLLTRAAQIERRVHQIDQQVAALLPGGGAAGRQPASARPGASRARPGEVVPGSSWRRMTIEY